MNLLLSGWLFATLFFGQARPRQLQAGDVAPNIPLITLEGRYQLSSLPGRVALLDFFNSG